MKSIYVDLDDQTNVLVLKRTGQTSVSVATQDQFTDFSRIRIINHTKYDLTLVQFVMKYIIDDEEKTIMDSLMLDGTSYYYDIPEEIIRTGQVAINIIVPKQILIFSTALNLIYKLNRAIMTLDADVDPLDELKALAFTNCIYDSATNMYKYYNISGQLVVQVPKVDAEIIVDGNTILFDYIDGQIIAKDTLGNETIIANANSLITEINSSLNTD